MRIGVRRLLLAGAALVVATTDAAAQTPTPAQTPPPVTTPPPTTAPPPATTPIPPPATTSPPATTPPATTTTPPPPTSPQAQVFGKVLSVDDAVAIALDIQPNIKARISDYVAAAFRVDQALAPLFPQITASATAAKDKGATSSIFPTGSNRVVTTTTESPFDLTVARITVSQLIFDFGKNFASTEAARKLADVALEDTELQRQLVTQTVKESFTNINFAVRLIQVQQQAVDRAELNLRSARGFFEVGTRPKSDVARAEVDVANARVDLIRARNAERLARVALATAMGLPATTPLAIQDNLIYQPVALDRTRLAEDALRMRPEYRQSRLNADANEARLRRSFRDFFPDITAGGFYGATRGDLNEAWEINLNLNWTIFDGGNRIARYREARANLEAAQARVKASELDISREVEQSVNNVIEADERIQAAQVAVASAQENFRLAQGRFDAGVGTILELTDAQLALTQAQNTEAQALADYRIALARLDRAVGRR
ncbi:MAG TPA: TolC family protein [Methylomirabilota bacterium]|jgi:outer membrane protein TolC